MALTPDQRGRLRRVTEDYVAAVERGETPRLEDLMAQHPDLAQDLAGFAVFYQTAERTRLRPGDMIPTARELSAAQRALAARFGAGTAPPASLLDAGRRAGMDPPELAARLGIGLDVLGKLERRLIRAASVPSQFLARLGALLETTPAALAAYLDAGPRPAAAGALLHAAAPPGLPAPQSFADALRSSALTDAAARDRWLALSPEDGSP